VTALPNVSEVVVSGVPLPGDTVMSSASAPELYAGLVPSAVMVTVSPFTRPVASVKVTPAPDDEAALTVSDVADPPEGVYVTV
jgi:hypothetical protein